MAGNTGSIELIEITKTNTLRSYQSSRFAYITSHTVIDQPSSASQTSLEASLANRERIIVISSQTWTFIHGKISEVIARITSNAIIA